MSRVTDSGQATLLVVDDEPINIRIIKKILCDLYQIRFASSGEKALEIASSQEVDLILLDVNMPDMDGYEVCRCLKSDPATRSIPVIFVTARTEAEDETRGFALGGVDYITKPLSPPVVRARVKTQIDLKHQRDLLEKLSMIDTLTKIPNRRRFDETLRRELAAAARAQSAFTLMILDVDFFKQYNDAYGHTRGDDCLRAIAGALESTFSRPTDLVARYGGEEFGVVLRETGFEGSCAMVARIHDSVRALGLRHPTSTVAGHVTVSVGAVSLVPKPSLSPSVAVDVADRLLYEAKQGGRKRGVCVDLNTRAKRIVIHPGSSGELSLVEPSEATPCTESFLS